MRSMGTWLMAGGNSTSVLDDRKDEKAPADSKALKDDSQILKAAFETDGNAATELQKYVQDTYHDNEDDDSEDDDNNKTFKKIYHNLHYYNHVLLNILENPPQFDVDENPPLSDPELINNFITTYAPVKNRLSSSN